MQLSDFTFKLPSELIARYPTKTRSKCRLLSLDGMTGETQTGIFTDILTKLNSGDLLVFNDTRVIPARLYGCKITGGKVEILIERILDNNQALAHVKASKSPKAGAVLRLGDNGDVLASVLSREDGLFKLQFRGDVFDILEHIGHIPLPPYIDRLDEKQDRELYQTVYSKVPGAVAAPTAGLHFDDDLIGALKAKGISMAFLTLHVGVGTFRPVQVNDICQHHMHAEYAAVPKAVVDAVMQCKARGSRVVAVGTTSARALESAALQSGVIRPFYADTQIFIYPGFSFNIVDALITNFHLPESTLLMLISAFAGHKNTMNAYKIAVKERFRFFSYGDAMWITKKSWYGQ